ncbi:hypothetical protein KIN20_022046 [Parelaphostrongylus tenuis]|uniref:Uncharacterized protein n=1 Tax=Parelaphostrongylus tenuis TaxID=148309 RepID=A0AAD5QRZ6_PARTN|nr:hypothetical protein KIN20_022046 [Parelaphostrongylus tenuis]
MEVAIPIASQRSHRPDEGNQNDALTFLIRQSSQRFAMQQKRGLIVRPRQNYCQQLTERLKDILQNSVGTCNIQLACVARTFEIILSSQFRRINIDHKTEIGRSYCQKIR